MSNNTKIEWTNKTWNPVTGCTKVSQGCKNCYAETYAKRFWGKREFTDVKLHKDRINQPNHYRKPYMIFVNSMSDLFHEDVPLEFIVSVFNIMAGYPLICRKKDCDHEDPDCYLGASEKNHIYQILTKRPERMLKVLTEELPEFVGNYFPGDAPLSLMLSEQWPLPNVWLGVSVEDQQTADERIPFLLRIPATIKFLSVEPMLERIDLQLMGRNYGRVNLHEYIDWVICGGESGKNARPMHPDWARSLRDQCQAANMPFFFKQWGQFIPSYNAGERSNEVGYYNKSVGNNWVRHYYQFPDGQGMVKIGKTKAGNFLDGKQYLQYPIE